MFVKFIDRKKVIALITIILGIGLAVVSYWVQHNYFLGLFLNLASLLIGLGVGILAINLYLEKDKQKLITYTVFSIIEPTFHTARKEILELIYEEFSTKDFVTIVAMYDESAGDFNSINPDYRNKIYNIVKNNYEKLEALLNILSKDSKEVVFIVGGNILESDLLCELLFFQRDVDYFRQFYSNEIFKDKDTAQKFLDCVIRSYAIHSRMKDNTSEIFSKKTEFGWVLSDLPDNKAKQLITK